MNTKFTSTGGFVRIILAGIFVALFACETNDETPALQKVKFGFSDTGNNSSGRSKTETEPHSILLTIENEDGPVLENQTINLSKFGSEYVTIDGVELAPGNYALTKFLVFDESDEVIMAAPVEDSEKAYLVDDPLPIAFTVVADDVNSIFVEVVNVNGEVDNPEDFGYGFASFTLNPVATFTLDTRVKDRSDGASLVADILIQGFNEDDEIELEQVFHSSASSSIDVELLQDMEYYRIYVVKDGYYELEYFFTPAQLTRGTICCDDADELTLALVPTTDYHQIQVSGLFKGNWDANKYPQNIFVYVPSNGCSEAPWIDFGGFIPNFVNIGVHSTIDGAIESTEIVSKMDQNDNVGDDFFGIFQVNANNLCLANPGARYFDTFIHAQFGLYNVQVSVIWDMNTGLYTQADQYVYWQGISSMEELFTDSYDLNE